MQWRDIHTVFHESRANQLNIKWNAHKQGHDVDAGFVAWFAGT
jgi:hypothetical protein